MSDAIASVHVHVKVFRACCRRCGLSVCNASVRTHMRKLSSDWSIVPSDWRIATGARRAVVRRVRCHSLGRVDDAKRRVTPRRFTCRLRRSSRAVRRRFEASCFCNLRRSSGAVRRRRPAAWRRRLECRSWKRRNYGARQRLLSSFFNPWRRRLETSFWRRLGSCSFCRRRR